MWPFKRRSMANPVVIPVPDDAPTGAYDRVSQKLLKANPAEASRQMREKGRAIAERDMQNALKAGATSYIWRTAGDGDVCERCSSRDGKRFTWKRPPAGGHPGTCADCPSGWCRCYAQPVIS